MSEMKNHKSERIRDRDTRPSSPRSRVVFVVNRLLIVLAVAAILSGLFFDQWRIVLINAVLL
jgi:hypothetical protein